MPALHTVAETSGFLADAEAEGMNAASRVSLIDRIAADPETGDLIVGSGGIRKLRVAGRGKGDRDTFGHDEIKAFGKLTASIKAHWQRRRSR